MYRRKVGKENHVGRDRFEDIFDRFGLKLRRKIHAPKTTDSSHGLPLYLNIIKDYIPTGINQLWVNDITFVTLWRDIKNYTLCYLSLILDAYSEKFIG